MLALALSAALCDAEATTAGEMMALHQSGASRAALTAAADRLESPARAAALMTQIIAAETSNDPDARELAAYHFAAEVHRECTISG